MIAALNSFLARWKIEPGLVLLALKPLVSRRRYASQVLQKRSNTCAQVITGFIKVIEDSTITPAHSEEPYMHKYGKFVETPIPRTRT